jgi:hypothetical protein
VFTNDLHRQYNEKSQEPMELVSIVTTLCLFSSLQFYGSFRRLISTTVLLTKLS